MQLHGFMSTKSVNFFRPVSETADMKWRTRQLKCERGLLRRTPNYFYSVLKVAQFSSRDQASEWNSTTGR